MTKKWLWATIFVLIMTLPISAQQITQATKDTPVFSSIDLMINCVAQFKMGDQRLMLLAIATGEAFPMKAGDNYIVMQKDGDLYQLLIGGKPGLWYTAKQFLK